jgi:ABC-type polysaccharide/polyol phosphate transport system ATPase subunit
MTQNKQDDVIIQVVNLGKCYRIYDSPKDRLKQALWRGRRQYYREFWALRNISLEVRRGETLGIIGRNGSGKSTLLQMICGTLTPTEGALQTHGRVAALLELGSGFNPEFTGRENVAINARLLGLSEKEVDEKFDEIVEFSEIGQFIDQPVKTYSSGMFVRVAFAIASHSDPDILIVDEALSVGDFAFQNKCITRIKQLRDKGMTLIFVSHDLSTLQLICNRAIWIHEGQLKAVGDPVQICQDYYAFTANNNSSLPPGPTQSVVPQHGTGMARFVEIGLDPSTSETVAVKTGGSIKFRFTLQALVNLENIVFAISIFSADGTWLVGQTSREEGVSWPPMLENHSCVGFIELRPLLLGPGDYKACIGAYNHNMSLVYALSDLYLGFSVRSEYPSWGYFHHPCRWLLCSDQTDASKFSQSL